MSETTELESANGFLKAQWRMERWVVRFLREQEAAFIAGLEAAGFKFERQHSDPERWNCTPPEVPGGEACCGPAPGSTRLQAALVAIDAQQGAIRLAARKAEEQSKARHG